MSDVFINEKKHICFLESHYTMKAWWFLILAILSEVVATSALKASDGFNRLWPSVIVILGYSIAFYFLSLTLKTIPISVAYAIWSGVGVALLVGIGWWFFDQKLDWPVLLGLGFIIVGVGVIRVFSKDI